MKFVSETSVQNRQHQDKTLHLQSYNTNLKAVQNKASTGPMKNRMSKHFRKSSMHSGVNVYLYNNLVLLRLFNQDFFRERLCERLDFRKKKTFVRIESESRWTFKWITYFDISIVNRLLLFKDKLLLLNCDKSRIVSDKFNRRQLIIYPSPIYTHVNLGETKVFRFRNGVFVKIRKII